MKWELKTVTIEELSENEENPRTISKEQAKQLRTSIERFGICQPIVVNTNGNIIGGHQRLSILKAMGRKRVEVYCATEELSPSEEKELSIRLNRNTGEWDYDVLANTWEHADLLDLGFDLKELGLGEKEEEVSQEIKVTLTITCPDNSTADQVIESFSKAMYEFDNITYKTKVK